jgi:hypothetical protein
LAQTLLIFIVMTKEKTLDARLPGAWIPSDLLAKAQKSAGPRGFSAWIRSAIEHELVRREVRTNANEYAHLNSETAQESAHLVDVASKTVA